MPFHHQAYEGLRPGVVAHPQVMEVGGVVASCQGAMQEYREKAT